MSIYYKYKTYCLKKPRLINKNYLEINFQEIQSLSSSDHKRSNTELIGDSLYYYPKKLKNKSLFRNTQITKENNKDTVEQIINSLLNPNSDTQIDNKDQKKTNPTHNTKKNILNEIISLNTSEIKMKSFETDAVGEDRLKDRKKILSDIKEYETRKKYSNVLAKSRLNERAASIEWMFNFSKDRRMCFKRDCDSISHSIIQKKN